MQIYNVFHTVKFDIKWNEILHSSYKERKCCIYRQSSINTLKVLSILIVTRFLLQAETVEMNFIAICGSFELLLYEIDICMSISYISFD